MTTEWDRAFAELRVRSANPIHPLGLANALSPMEHLRCEASVRWNLWGLSPDAGLQIDAIAAPTRGFLGLSQGAFNVPPGSAAPVVMGQSVDQRHRGVVRAVRERLRAIQINAAQEEPSTGGQHGLPRFQGATSPSGPGTSSSGARLGT